MILAECHVEPKVRPGRVLLVVLQTTATHRRIRPRVHRGHPHARGDQTAAASTIHKTSAEALDRVR